MRAKTIRNPAFVSCEGYFHAAGKIREARVASEDRLKLKTALGESPGFTRFPQPPEQKGNHGDTPSPYVRSNNSIREACLS